MLDLIVNSLRMRPDRVIMGEVRRREEAEVLFEAMHTGHSVYSTIHADTSRHLVRRLSKPPFELPVEDLEAIDLVIVQFRDRRSGRRRTLEVAEIMPSEDKDEVNLNYLYRWDARSDSFEKINESKRLFEKLNLYTGMSDDEIKKDLKEKKAILEWMRDKGVEDIESVGETIGEYYRDREAFMKRVKK
jgi:flagellar protein FlaI